MMLMDKLDAAAANGASIDVFWYYDPEDDTMQELGEEFGEDLGRMPNFILRRWRADAGDDLFVAEEAVIAAAERLVADGGFPTARRTATLSSSCSRATRSCSAPPAG